MERRLYADRLPVIWWDQPRQPAATDSRSYEALVVASADRLNEAYGQTGRPVPVLAHSFAAHLVTDLSRAFHRQIASITLLAGSPSMSKAFERMATYLIHSHGVTSLAASLQAFRAKSSREALWELIGALASIPNYLDYLWAPTSAGIRDQLRPATAAPDFLDSAVFQSVLNSFLDRSPPALPVEFAGPVTVITGMLDPYADVEADEGAWRKYFPSARLVRLQTGHLPHLESPPAVWLRAS